MQPSTKDRIVACLVGVATGDAVGKQTENLSNEDVRRWYPHGVNGFEGQPGSPIPRYVGNRRHEWLIGETTDDTERTVAVARAILRDRVVDHTSVGRELLKCRKSVHPGVRSLWEFHQACDPARVAERHDGCGAAIRVAPVGILYEPVHLEDLVAAAREASVSTHGGAVAIAAAAATAAAVSAAIDGMSPSEIVEIAEQAAERVGAAGVTFAKAVHDIHQDLIRLDELRPAEIAARYFPNTPLTIVPLALALGTLMNSTETVILVATNIGGDSDSVASIAGGIVGARCPDTINAHWHAVVESVNHHDLATLAEGLAVLRH